MKKRTFILIALAFTIISFKANAQTNAIYPQVYFDSTEALTMLGQGQSSIDGVAFTRVHGALTPKITGQYTVIDLYPVTGYFTEWYKLRKKKEGKGTSVFMSQQAFRFRLTTQTDGYGNFKFINMKPGKYFLQAFVNYKLSGTYNVFTGSDRNQFGGGTDYYTRQAYTQNYTNRIEKFVEIDKDGQSIEVKLK